MTDYDFIDPDRPERKREVQRRVEAQENSTGNNSSTTEVNSDKVAEENSGIVTKLKTAIGGFLK
jgi:hypothetical protein